MKNLIITLLSIVMFSCSISTKKNAVIQLKHQVLSDSEIVDENFIIGSANSLVLRDSLLVVQGQRSDRIFYFVKIDGSYLGAYGTRGQGPNEFSFPSSLYAYDKNKFGFYDINKVCYSMMELKDNQISFDEVFKIASMGPFCMYPVIDDCYISVGMNTTQRFSLWNNKGEMLGSFCEYPYRDDKEKIVSNDIRAQAYQGALATNQSRNKLVHAISSGEILTFCEIRDGKVELIKEVIKSYPTYNYDNETGEYMGQSSHSPNTYIGVCATEEYVYALYSGKCLADDGLMSFLGKEIQVYNWQGELIQKYELDTNVNCICVDKHDETMYAIANNPDPQIVKFALNK